MGNKPMKYLAETLAFTPKSIESDIISDSLSVPNLAELCLIGNFENSIVDELREKDITVYQMPSTFKNEEEFNDLFQNKRLVHKGYLLNFNIKQVNDDELLFQGKEVSYLFKGVSNISANHLKMICSVEHEGKHYVDRIDLYSYRSRKNVCADLQEVLGIQKSEKDLLNIYKYFERKMRQSTSIEVEKPVLLSQVEIREAKKALKTFDLITFFTDLITELNYIGETNNKRLIFLIALSRKLPSPISGAIRSASSSGKTFLLETLGSILPEEELVFASRLTSGSLYYLPKDFLRQKLLIIDETKGASEATEYSIRSLQSRKKLTLAVVKRDNTGKQKTVMFDVLGPISFLDSSTSFDTNPENLNRTLILQLDESPEQTLRIFEAQKKKRSLDTINKDLSSQIKLAKNMQRLLRPIPVIIPFIDQINFPPQYLDSRRKFEMLLTLTETICFLFQYQRKIIQKEKGEFLEATIQDYKLAYELTIEIFQATFTDLDQFSHALLNEIKDAVLIQAKQKKVDIGEITFSRKDLLDWTNRREHELKKLLPNLERLDYLIKKAQGRGGRFTYTLNFKQIMEPDLGITHPDELFSPDLVVTK